MQFSLEFESEGNYATARVWGPASLEEMRQLSEALIAQPSWRRGMALILDGREMETEHLSRSDIQAMAESTLDFNEAMGDGKGAIVVSGDLAFGLARMWNAYNEDRITTRNRVFRSMDEAMCWIREESDAEEG